MTSPARVALIWTRRALQVRRIRANIVIPEVIIGNDGNMSRAERQTCQAKNDRGYVPFAFFGLGALEADFSPDRDT
jgi:hypothetical protein